MESKIQTVRLKESNNQTGSVDKTVRLIETVRLIIFQLSLRSYGTFNRVIRTYFQTVR